MRKILSLILVFILMFTFCACGGSSEKGHEFTGESINIVIQTNGLGEKWITDVAESYTFDTGVEVNVQFDALLSQNMNSILTTDTMECADIYFGQGTDWIDYYKNGLITEITDIYTEKVDGESLQDRCTVQDYYIENDDGSKSYAMIPLSMGPIGMSYNKAMMSYLCKDVLKWEDGHDYPTTTYELEQVIDALNKTVNDGINKELFSYTSAGKEQNVKAFAWSGSIGTLEFLFKAWIQQYWGNEYMEKFYSTTDSAEIFNDEAFYICYQKIIDLLDLSEKSDGTISSDSSIPNCLSYNHTESQQQFLMGHSLFIPAGSWLYSESSELMEDVDNWGFMPVPVLTDENGKALSKEGVEVPTDENGNYIAYLGINNQDYLFIPKRSEKQDLAKNFLRYFFSKDSLATVEENFQAPVCFTCNDSEIELNGWAGEVDKFVRSSVEKNALCQTYTTNPLFGTGALSFTADVLPYAKLSQGGYGSISKYYDSATLQPIADKSSATGTAISENVYKYCQWCYNYKLSHWNEYLRKAGLIV